DSIPRPSAGRRAGAARHGDRRDGPVRAGREPCVRNLPAGQRAARDPGARPRHARRGREPVVRRRQPERARGPHRLRPPVRAHDVRGFGQRTQGRAHSPAAGRRRHGAERIDRLGPHQLLPGGAAQPNEPGAVAGGRPHAGAERDPRAAGQPAGDRQGRAAPARGQRAVHPLPAAGDGRGRVQPPHLLFLRARGHRQHGRPERRAHRRRAGVLPHLLLAQQRHAGAGRRLRPRRGAPAGGRVLRRHPQRARGAGRGVHGSVRPPSPPRHHQRPQRHAAGVHGIVRRGAGRPSRRVRAGAAGHHPGLGAQLAPEPAAGAAGARGGVRRRPGRHPPRAGAGVRAGALHAGHRRGTAGSADRRGDRPAGPGRSDGRRADARQEPDARALRPLPGHGDGARRDASAVHAELWRPRGPAGRPGPLPGRDPRGRAPRRPPVPDPAQPRGGDHHSRPRPV
ncbi:MAG: hypothetical protein AVDCRST_MAG89-4609, partial [uncultured Gemmatimonadetes bacterium]